MNYSKYLTGDLVMPPRKRTARMVWTVRRIGGTYDYTVLGPRDRKECYWEHQLVAVRRQVA